MSDFTSDYATRETVFHCESEHAYSTISSLDTAVEFGNMQSNGDCIGIGVCRITTTHYFQHRLKKPRQRSCPLAFAQLHVLPNGRMALFFPKAGMLPCTERAFFKQRVFPVSVPYYLPDEIREQLPELQTGILDAGLHPIRPTDSGYWVTF